jgi:alpha-ketoglutarate-dependent taurine dioxygenase
MRGPDHAELAPPDIEHLAKIFREEGVVCLPSLPLSAQAQLCWAIWQHFGRHVVWVADSLRTLDQFWEDLLTLRPHPDLGAALFPPRDADATPGAPPRLISGRAAKRWHWPATTSPTP